MDFIVRILLKIDCPKTKINGTETLKSVVLIKLKNPTLA